MGDLNIQNLYPKTKTVGIKIIELYSLETQMYHPFLIPLKDFDITNLRLAPIQLLQ